MAKKSKSLRNLRRTCGVSEETSAANEYTAPTPGLLKCVVNPGYEKRFRQVHIYAEQTGNVRGSTSMVPVDRHRECDGRAGCTVLDRAPKAHQNVLRNADRRQSDNDPDESDNHEVRGQHRDQKYCGGRQY